MGEGWTVDGVQTTVTCWGRGGVLGRGREQGLGVPLTVVDDECDGEESPSPCGISRGNWPGARGEAP